jgi:putative Mg2+ transporter-C (MgtC) family protein
MMGYDYFKPTRSPMTAEAIVIFEHLLAALAAGGLIGLERNYHGRAAGFRTHALVAVAATALMLVTLYPDQLFPAGSTRVSVDPTRMAQGIMTGIGFLGAGVIFKEGLTVRGLTTAASIWVTSALGILAGLGFYFPLIVTTLLTLGILSVFRWIETQIPVQLYAHLDVGFSADAPMPEADFRRFIEKRGFTIANLDYRYRAEERTFDYVVVIWTKERDNVSQLAERLRGEPAVREFQLAQMGD